MSTSSDAIIEVDGVRKAFSDTTALAGVDLSVDTGRVLALLGPNGAGKTTLVRILATLLTPDAGRVTVAGYDTVREAPAVRSVIGLTGQHSAVDDLLTGRENLEMLGALYHLSRPEARRRTESALADFGLTGRRITSRTASWSSTAATSSPTAAPTSSRTGSAAT